MDNEYTDSGTTLQTKKMTETVLSIAGSDPTGGAGIQADLKTMTAIGIYGAAAITCITVQNSHGVKRVQPLDPDLVGAQIEAVLSDHFVACVKIGMVGTASIAREIGKRLADFTGEIIYDPVLAATTGQALTDREALDTVRLSLISRSTVLTPNLPELEALTGTAMSDVNDITAGVNSLFNSNPGLRCVLVSGGHTADDNVLTDYLFHRPGSGLEPETIVHPRIRTGNTHGTGCTLASAYAAHLALGMDDSGAFGRSIGFLTTLIERSAPAIIVKNQKGCGGMLHHLGRL